MGTGEGLLGLDEVVGCLGLSALVVLVLVLARVHVVQSIEEVGFVGEVVEMGLGVLVEEEVGGEVAWGVDDVVVVH